MTVPRHTTNPLAIAITAVISLAIGAIGGFLVGVRTGEFTDEFLEGMVEDERPAEVADPKTLSREAFELRHPSNWRIDTEDPDYDPDHMFSIESPGTTFTMFIFGTAALDPEEHLKEQVAGQKELYGDPTVASFRRYGRYKGHGAELRGRIFGIRSTTRVFSFSRGGTSVVIVQQYPDEDARHVREGLKLIETSFALRAREDGGGRESGE